MVRDRKKERWVARVQDNFPLFVSCPRIIMCEDTLHSFIYCGVLAVGGVDVSSSRSSRLNVGTVPHFRFPGFDWNVAFYLSCSEFRDRYPNLEGSARARRLA